jgi:response regulator RpfG family c-di-GMP phosphodiesterase
MFIIFFLLFSFSANAKTVEATGYGKDKKIALEDAKTKAVEMVAGSWVDSSKKSVNGSMQQEIKQFTTGVVENYKVINENETKDEIAEMRKKNLEHARSNTSRLTKRVRQCAVMLAMRTQLSLQWTTHLQKTWIGFIRN